MPIYPQALSSALRTQTQSLSNYLAQQQAQQQGLQQMLMKAQLEQQMKMQDPLQQLLQRGQVADALSKISALGGDISQFQGVFQGGGGAGMPQGVPMPQGGAMPQGISMPQEGIMPPMPGAIDTTGTDLDTGRRVGVEPVKSAVSPQIGQFRAEELERIPFGGYRPKTLKRVPSEAEKKQEAKLKAKAEVLKLSEKARANFGRSIALFSTMVSQAKGMQEEQKETLGKAGVKTTGLGLLPGIVGGFGVKTRRPWAARTAAFRGQMRETAIGLNSILTGQNRVIRSVVQMIQETLPDPLDPEPMMATKLAQSITNAYKLVKAFEKAGLKPETLQQMSGAELNKVDARSLVSLYTLSSEEEKEVKRIIDDVLKTPAMPERKFQQPQEKGYTSEQRALINKYRQKYPNRSEEQIIKAMQKQGLLK